MRKNTALHEAYIYSCLSQGKVNSIINLVQTSVNKALLPDTTPYEIKICKAWNVGYILCLINYNQSYKLFWEQFKKNSWVYV